MAEGEKGCAPPQPENISERQVDACISRAECQPPPPRLAEMQGLLLSPLGSPGHPSYQGELVGRDRKLIPTDRVDSEGLDERRAVRR